MVTVDLTTAQVVTLILIAAIIFLLIAKCNFSCKKGMRFEGMVRSTLPSADDGMVQCGDGVSMPRNCQFTYGANSPITPEIYYKITGDGETMPCEA